jgi:hypothetical protein
MATTVIDSHTTRPDRNSSQTISPVTPAASPMNSFISPDTFFITSVRIDGKPE